MWTAKVERAKQLLKELTEDVESFFKTDPYKVGTRVDLSSKRLIYYVQEADVIPEKIVLLAGDIIQNLRSALDQLAHELFVKNGGDDSLARNVYFPVGKSLSAYDARKHQDTNGISANAKVLIDETRPYDGGNEVLWQIHELNIIDKHRALLTSGSAFQSVDIGAHLSSAMRDAFPDSEAFPVSLFVKPSDTLFPLAPGAELFIDASGSKPNHKMEFRFNIILNEPGIIEGAPIVEVLQSMVDTVESLEPIFRSEL